MKKGKAILLSVGVMVITGAALLVLFALIFGKMKALPRGIVPIITTVIGCLAVFLGGLISAAYAREKGLIFGIISGLIFSFCVALVSVLLLKNDFSIASVGKFAAILLSGSIGGILGVNRKDRVKF